jgi:hypothetical protein
MRTSADCTDAIGACIATQPRALGVPLGYSVQYVAEALKQLKAWLSELRSIGASTRPSSASAPFVLPWKPSRGPCRRNDPRLPCDPPCALFQPIDPHANLFSGEGLPLAYVFGFRIATCHDSPPADCSVPIITRAVQLYNIYNCAIIALLVGFFRLCICLV